jgi:hypothetical protein
MIAVSELLEICSYGIGQKQAQELGKHYAKYNDYRRIKDLIIQEFVRKNAELSVCQRQRRQYYEQLINAKQAELF